MTSSTDQQRPAYPVQDGSGQRQEVLRQAQLRKAEGEIWRRCLRASPSHGSKLDSLVLERRPSPAS